MGGENGWSEVRRAFSEVGRALAYEASRGETGSLMGA